MEKVNGLEEALATKVDKDGGETAETIATFPDVSGTAENLASGNTLKVLFGKIKNWLGRLKALAFKDKIKNADVDSAAAIEYSKLSGVAPLSHTHDDRYYTESEIDTKLNSKQDKLSWDSTPTASSTNPVTSGGVKTALDGKVTASGGEIGNTKVTFSDATGTRSNISSGDTAKNLFGKIKQWFAALGSLAFKSSITNSDVSSSAAIEKSKISGLGTLAGKSSIKQWIKSPSIPVLLSVLAVLAICLRNIIDQMVMILVIGACANWGGSLIYKAGDAIEKKPDKP